jgi:hypothetical protein
LDVGSEVTVEGTFVEWDYGVVLNPCSVVGAPAAASGEPTPFTLEDVERIGFVISKDETNDYIADEFSPPLFAALEGQILVGDASMFLGIWILEGPISTATGQEIKELFGGLEIPYKMISNLVVYCESQDLCDDVNDRLSN